MSTRRKCRDSRGILINGLCGFCNREAGNAPPQHHRKAKLGAGRTPFDVCGGPRTPHKRRFRTMAHVNRHSENVWNIKRVKLHPFRFRHLRKLFMAHLACVPEAAVRTLVRVSR